MEDTGGVDRYACRGQGSDPDSLPDNGSRKLRRVRNSNMVDCSYTKLKREIDAGNCPSDSETDTSSAVREEIRKRRKRRHGNTVASGGSTDQEHPCLAHTKTTKQVRKGRWSASDDFALFNGETHTGTVQHMEKSRYPEVGRRLSVSDPGKTATSRDELNITPVIFSMQPAVIGRTNFICGISALHSTDVFTCYMLPSDESLGDSQVQGNPSLTVKAGTLYHDGTRVTTRPLPRGMSRFLQWLKQFPRPVLIAHNADAFFHLFVDVADQCGLLQEYMQHVIGFVDSLPMMAALFPGDRWRNTKRGFLDNVALSTNIWCLSELLQKMKITSHHLLQEVTLFDDVAGIKCNDTTPGLANELSGTKEERPLNNDADKQYYGSSSKTCHKQVVHTRDTDVDVSHSASSHDLFQPPVTYMCEREKALATVNPKERRISTCEKSHAVSRATDTYEFRDDCLQPSMSAGGQEKAKEAKTLLSKKRLRLRKTVHAEFLTVDVPPIVTTLELRPVHTDSHHVSWVLFDMTTSVLGATKVILQLSAIHKSNIFNCYFRPQKQTYDSSGDVNKKQLDRERDGSCVQMIPLRRGLVQLLEWLRELPDPILVSHGGLRAQSRLLTAQFQNCGLLNDLQGIVIGFGSSLPVLKKRKPGLNSYCLHSLVDDNEYNTHDARENVKQLWNLLDQLGVSGKDLLSHTCSMKYVSYELQKRDNMDSLRCLLHHKVLTKSIVNRIAGSGLRMSHLRAIFQAHGTRGLATVFAEKKCGKPRVTQKIQVVRSLAAYLHGKSIGSTGT